MIQSHKKNIYEILGRESVHPFPARMSPGIALDILARTKKPQRVLDPMMGSGTVLAVAHSRGHQAIGIDIDPLAVLLSKVWTTGIIPDDVKNKAKEVLKKAESIFANLSDQTGYPKNSDQETQQFIKFWFDERARKQLTSLAAAIGRVKDSVTRNALWCGFSRLIITKKSGASLAMDLSHSRPHKAFSVAPIEPFQKFLAAVERVIENCINSENDDNPPTQINTGDARNLLIPNNSIDLVLTSPPYLNAIDYMRCSKFSLVWMGFNIRELRQLRANSVGTEARGKSIKDDSQISEIISELKLRPKLNPKDSSILFRYIDDMKRAVHEVARVLVPGGQAIYVVGENTIRGTQIRNSVIVTALAEVSCLKLCERRVRMLPANRRYLPPPSTKVDSSALDARMRREVVLAFTKTK